MFSIWQHENGNGHRASSPLSPSRDRFASFADPPPVFGIESAAPKLESPVNSKPSKTKAKTSSRKRKQTPVSEAEARSPEQEQEHDLGSPDSASSPSSPLSSE